MPKKTVSCLIVLKRNLYREKSNQDKLGCFWKFPDSSPYSEEWLRETADWFRRRVENFEGRADYVRLWCLSLLALGETFGSNENEMPLFVNSQVDIRNHSLAKPLREEIGSQFHPKEAVGSIWFKYSQSMFMVQKKPKLRTVCKISSCHAPVTMTVPWMALFSDLTVVHTALGSHHWDGHHTAAQPLTSCSRTHSSPLGLCCCRYLSHPT